jgi:diaminopimelate decarboxylase
MTMSTVVLSKLPRVTQRLNLLHSIPWTVARPVATDGAATPRRWLRYRNELPMAEIACPAEALRIDAIASWVRESRSAVDAYSSRDLSSAISAGVSPSRMIMHCDTCAMADLRRAVDLRVGTMVVSSLEQVELIASRVGAGRSQNVLIRMSNGEVGLPLAGGSVDATVDAVLADHRLRLVGLDSCVDGARGCGEVIDQLIGQMAGVHRHHGVVLTRLGLSVAHDIGTPSDPVQVIAATVEDALDDGCARFRFPRPLVVFSPGWDLVEELAA